MAGTGVNQERFTKTVLKRSLIPGNVTANVNGSAVDLKGFESATPMLAFAAFGGTSPTATFKIEESEDGSTGWAVAPDRDVLGMVNSVGLVVTPGSGDSKTHVFGYIGTKRHIRWAVSAVGGTSPSLPTSGNVMLSDARREPVTN